MSSCLWTERSSVSQTSVRWRYHRQPCEWRRQTVDKWIQTVDDMKRSCYDWDDLLFVGCHLHFSKCIFSSVSLAYVELINIIFSYKNKIYSPAEYIRVAECLLHSNTEPKPGKRSSRTMWIVRQPMWTNNIYFAIRWSWTNTLPQALFVAFTTIVLPSSCIHLLPEPGYYVFTMFNSTVEICRGYLHWNSVFCSYLWCFCLASMCLCLCLCVYRCYQRHVVPLHNHIAFSLDAKHALFIFSFCKLSMNSAIAPRTQLDRLLFCHERQFYDFNMKFRFRH